MCNLRKKTGRVAKMLTDFTPRSAVEHLEDMERFANTMFPSEGGKVLVPAGLFLHMQLELLDYHKLVEIISKEELELWKETYEETSRELKSLERTIALKDAIDERDEKNGN